MGDCSNFECQYQTWGDKIRCSKCRHSKDYTCTDCGRELDNNRAIKCKDCSRDQKALQARLRMSSEETSKRRRDNYKRQYEFCIICEKKLGKHRTKFCTKECFDTHLKIKLQSRYKPLNKGIPVN